jgi:hypothetical protein
MNVRDFLNNNSSVVTILAVVVLVFALGAIVMTSKGPSGRRGPVDLYFYDLNTGKVFIAASDQYPPIEVPSGATALGNNAGVKAYVFSCGECESYDGMTSEEIEASGGFIGRLEMYTAEELAVMEQARSGQGGPGAGGPAGRMPPMMLGPDMMMGGMLTKRPEDDTWVSANTQAGMSMMMDISKRCPSGRPKPCIPGR